MTTDTVLLSAFNNPLGGFQIVESWHMVVPTGKRRYKVKIKSQHKRPRWKPARMWRWAKETLYEPDPNVVVDKVNWMIYGHPLTIHKIRSAIEAMRQ